MHDATHRSFGTMMAVSAILWPGAWADAQEAPDTIVLSGVVRDFHEQSVPGGHPDFERIPDHGSGHYAGNVDLLLGPEGKPVFTGAGYRVDGQVTDAEGCSIAPHLYDRVYTDGPQACDILVDSDGDDAFEVCLVDVTFEDDGTSVWTYHVRELPGGKDLSHWNVLLDPSHVVLPGTTPGYEFGLDGSTGYFGIKWETDDDFSEGDFTIVLDGRYFGAPTTGGILAKGGTAHDLGDMFVPTTVLSTTGYAYTGADLLEDDPLLGDSPGAVGPADSGAIASAGSFDQWYRNVPGVNMSNSLAIVLELQDDGCYVFDDKIDPEYVPLGGFFPIDDALLGNSAGLPDHNFHFTYELHTTFIYDASAEQMFQFTGDDDVWVFVDGKLVIDLGGVHSSMTQCIDLDRCGLVDGEAVKLDFFFAERHRNQSNFRIKTNIELISTGLPAVTAAFD